MRRHVPVHQATRADEYEEDVQPLETCRRGDEEITREDVAGMVRRNVRHACVLDPWVRRGRRRM
jgi:hypothetical protein